MHTNPQRGKFETNGTYGDSAKFTPVRDDLWTAPAFLCLKPIEQIILIDFINRYNQRTDFDRKPDAQLTRILYTWGMCSIACAKNTFYSAMKTLQQHRFVIPDFESVGKRGSATRWLSSSHWRTWTPDIAQLRILNSYQARRASSVENPDQLRFPFVQGLTTLNRAARSAPSNITHVSQTVETILEEQWTKSASQRQAQRHAK